MSRCKQELCPNWSGDGLVCPSDHLMRSTKSGFQCPTCDAHEVCSLLVCGFDSASGDCGLNAADQKGTS